MEGFLSKDSHWATGKASPSAKVAASFAKREPEDLRIGSPSFCDLQKERLSRKNGRGAFVRRGIFIF
jgi:hypothetical protein